MRQSHIIEVDGVFVAAAASYPDRAGFRLVAMTPRTHAIDGVQVRTLPQAYSLARSVWRQPGKPAPSPVRPRPC